MIGIYKITSPSGKIYIGQSINIDKRRIQYSKLECKNQPKILNSLKKYGPENHIFEILEECTLDQLNEREIYWKQYYLNKLGWKKVLFCELHDSGGGPKSEETKLNQSKGLKNSYSKGERKAYWSGKTRDEHSNLMKIISGFRYKRTQDHIEQRKKLAKDMWVGRKKEIGENISKAKKGKTILKIECLETKEIFNGLSECSAKTGISMGCISNFCNGKYPYSNLRGFTFRYI